MSEEVKNDAVKEEAQAKESEEKKSLFPEKDGYFLLEHKINGKHMAMYVEKDMHPLHAFEGSFNYAEHFRVMYYKQHDGKKEQDAAAKEAEPEKNDESSSEEA